MRLALFLSAAMLLLTGIGAANAADPKLLAATGGFLLGNAHRCAVSAERVIRTGKVIRDMIAAASQDAREEELAAADFAKAFSSNAYPGAEGNAVIPPCQAVVMQFEQLERHHQQAGFTDRGPQRRGVGTRHP